MPDTEKKNQPVPIWRFHYYAALVSSLLGIGMAAVFLVAILYGDQEPDVLSARRRAMLSFVFLTLWNAAFAFLILRLR